MRTAFFFQRIFCFVLLLRTTFVAGQPGIHSFTPTSGPAGTTVTINGSNFDTNPVNNIVYFGATKGTVITSTSTRLTVQVPTGATYHPLTVTVNKLTAYAAKPFTLTFAGCGPNNNIDFGQHIDYPIPGKTNCIEASDLNSDGRPDVIAGITDYGISALKNFNSFGDIGFSVANNYPHPMAAGKLAVGDFDGDGRQDVVSTSFFNKTISIFKNTSAGGDISFSLSKDYTLVNQPMQATVGDIDGDGKPDIAVTCFMPGYISTINCTVAIFRNTTIGNNISFAPEQLFPTLIDPRSPVISDIDGDGKPELIFVNYNSFSFSVFKNKSTPGIISFESRLDFSTGTYYPTSIATGDLNGDDKPDIALTSYTPSSDRLQLFTNNSNGTISFSPAQMTQTSRGVWDIAIGDVNGDGKADIVVPGYVNNEVSVHLNTSTGPIIIFASLKTYTTGSYPESVLVMDTDGDGRPDITSGNYLGASISVLKNKIPAQPNLKIESQPSFCSSNTGTITAMSDIGQSPFQYSLDGINFQNGGTFTNLAAGTYKITVKDANGCTKTDSVAIVNLQAPQLTATSIASGCNTNNGSITANASGGAGDFQYKLNNAPYQVNRTFTGLPAGSYTLSVKDKNNCIQTITVVVGNTPVPQLELKTTSPSCNDNGSIHCTGTGGKSPFQYSLDGNTFQTSQTFSGLAAGQYTITIKDANGCSAAITTALLSNSPGISGNVINAVCGTNTGRITVTGLGGTPPYQFSFNNSVFQTNGSFTNLAPGQYLIKLKDASGCIVEESYTIHNTCLILSVNFNDATCGNNNGKIDIVASGGAEPYSYSLDGLNFQTAGHFPGLAPGIYTVVVKDAAGISQNTNVTIADVNGPRLTSVISDASCANNDGTISLKTAGGLSPLLFSIDGANFQTNTIFTGLAAGNYTVMAKDANGCLATQIVNVNLVNTITVDAGPGLTKCEGDSTLLSASSNGTSFLWSPSEGLDNPNILTPRASPSKTTEYTLTATTGACSGQSTVTVFINPAPIARAGSDISVCLGRDAQLNAQGGTIFSWSPALHLSDPGIPNPKIISPQEGIFVYTLRVSDANGCQSSPDSLKIYVRQAELFLDNDTIIAINQPLQLHAIDVNNVGFSQYKWAPGFGLDNSESKDPVAILEKGITYQVLAQTPDGCIGKDDITVMVYKGPDIYVPTAFTPNADGLNDILKVKLVGIKELKHFTLFNRWGERVFSTKDQMKGWDGNFRGQSQNTDTFIWVIEAVDYKGSIIFKKGTTTLIR